MNQIAFLFGLYSFGVLFGQLFKRQLPYPFIAITGLLWGGLFWVLGGIILQILSIPYTFINMAALFILLGSGLSIIHIKRNTWQLSDREVIWLLSIALVFILVLILGSQFNFSHVSSDSIVQIITGRRIANEGFNSAVIEELSLRGIYLSQLQSSSVFLGDDYLYVAQPGFAITFLLVFFYLSQRIIYHHFHNKVYAVSLAILACLALFSTYFIVFQFFYIHNNMISAVYFFVAVSVFWMALVEEEWSWMAMGTLALLGFSLARNEAPIFALIILVLAISTGKITYRVRLRSILPYLLILFLWYLYLLVEMGEGTKILNPERTLVILGSLAGFFLLVVLSEVKWIKQYLLPHLPKIMLGFLLLILIVMVIEKPDHMKESVYIMILNMVIYGRWGIIWIIFSLLLVISQAIPRVIHEELFIIGVPSFYSVLLALSYFRPPFRIGWYDSANRMSTHILPLIILYVLMKVAQGLSERSQLLEKENTQSIS